MVQLPYPFNFWRNIDNCVKSAAAEKANFCKKIQKNEYLG
jgi:hypothetical protein